MNTVEEKLIKSDLIQECIITTLNSLKKPPDSFDKVLLKINSDIKRFIIFYLNENSPTIKDEEFQKDIIAHKNGIISAIEISKNVEEKYNSLVTSLVENSPIEMLNEKQELASILKEEISNQLSDIILGLWDVRKKLKGKNNAMKRFKYLTTVCNESNEMVKVFLINSLQTALCSITNNGIEGIDYKSLDEIEELSLKEALDKWDTVIPYSQTIIEAIGILMEKRLYSNTLVKSDPDKQTNLKNALRFVKTLASHLPELVGQRNYLPNLSAIHSDEYPFLKKFTSSELEKIPEDQLADYVNALYETASEGLEDRSLLEEAVERIEIEVVVVKRIKEGDIVERIEEEEVVKRIEEEPPISKPSLLDRFKSFSPQIRLLIVLVVIVAVVIAASLLLVYFLSSKDTSHQMVV
ncbi:hypothetical protein NEOKW01_1336 [Nematocida sp. AWRm80]|nr:hypothetical protein NEOKW01_1336 [Nematocida sp. AWRm80]